MYTIAVKISQLKEVKEETCENSGLNGNRTHDLYDSGAVQRSQSNLNKIEK